MKREILILLCFVAMWGCKKENEPALPKEQKYYGLGDIVLEEFPASGTQNSVFTLPSIKLSRPALQSFNLTTADFRSVVDSCVVSRNGEKLKGSLKYSTDSLKVYFIPFETLPSNSSIQVVSYTHWDQKKSGSDWVRYSLTESENTTMQTFSFTTTNAPTILDSTNIEFIYPQPNQYHFLKSEYPYGFFTMKVSQSYLFKSPIDQSALKLKVTFTSKSSTYTVPAVFDESTKKVQYDIPKDLKNEEIYSIEIFAEPLLNGGPLISFMKYYIRTSVYNNFSEKLNVFAIESNGFIWNVEGQSVINYLGVNCRTPEFFDKTELLLKKVNNDPGLISQNGLVRLKALPSNNKWFNFINSEYYIPAKENGIKLSRPEEPFGIPPLKAMYIEQDSSKWINLKTLQDNAPTYSGFFLIIYNLNFLVSIDYFHIRNEVGRKSIQNKNEWTKRISNSFYNFLSSGVYKYEISYNIPGIEKPTSQREFIINKQ